ncbi:MAG: hypothetical protein P4L22_03870 [Candidatus Babeliales bacterium]|nr:hypothetical protein [Candidatus Babeliales bacterium]
MKKSILKFTLAISILTNFNSSYSAEWALLFLIPAGAFIIPYYGVQGLFKVPSLFDQEDIMVKTMNVLQKNIKFEECNDLLQANSEATQANKIQAIAEYLVATKTGLSGFTSELNTQVSELKGCLRSLTSELQSKMQKECEFIEQIEDIKDTLEEINYCLLGSENLYNFLKLHQKELKNLITKK